ncbi:MAG: hypothetical protein CL677_07270 [Bdellovibrionaceae bacterium]|nr:hypothetical protein [Pseudobdellovibrionaceae bacterium]|tara:strand:+ start:60018 stop:60797 length:780 start_codon:yes stop_codon:yes gene_type:complete
MKTLFLLFTLSALVHSPISVVAAPRICGELFGVKSKIEIAKAEEKSKQKPWEKQHPRETKRMFSELSGKMATSMEMNSVFSRPDVIFKKIFQHGMAGERSSKELYIEDSELQSIAHGAEKSPIFSEAEASRLLEFGKYLDEQINRVQSSNRDQRVISSSYMLRAETEPTVDSHSHKRSTGIDLGMAFTFVKSEMGAGSVLEGKASPEGSLLVLTEGARRGFYERFEENFITGEFEGTNHGSGWDGRVRLIFIRQYFYEK